MERAPRVLLLIALQQNLGVSARRPCQYFGDAGADSWCARSSVVAAEGSASPWPVVTGVGADRWAGRAGQHGSRVKRLVDHRTVRRPDWRVLRSEDDRHPSRIAGALLHPRANETLLQTRAAMVAATAPLHLMRRPCSRAPR